MRFALFVVLLLPCTPVMVLAYVFVAARGIAYARRHRVSATAIGPLFSRWALDRLGTRHDPVGARLFEAVPMISPLAIAMITEPVLWASRVSGHLPKFLAYPNRRSPSLLTQMNDRTYFFDTAIDQARTEIRQVVILGAGFCTRSLTHAQGLAVFEVDRPRMQALKRSLLAQVGADVDHVTFVPVDFNEGSWLEGLTQAGFDPGSPTFVLWEGVTMYLPRTVIERTLTTVASLPQGSLVAFDYLSEALVHPTSGPWTWLGGTLRAADESWVFGLSTAPPSAAAARRLVEGCGLELVRHELHGTEGGRAYGGFALARVPD